ncbi:MAG: ABC transporter permease [Chloroflexota bacterium]
MNKTAINPAILEADATSSQRGVWSGLWRQFRSDFGAQVGLLLTLIIIVVAVFADVIAPYGPTDGDFSSARLPPAWVEGGSMDHLLGTDQLGQDIFTRIVYGSRVSLTVSIFGVLLAMSIGVTAGMVAGLFGGRVDAAISAVVNLILSVPYLILVIVVATILGRSLINVILIFGVTDSPIFARITRGEVLRLRNEEYVEAARSLGANNYQILFFHIFPNLLRVLITVATFEMSAMIFYESGLSFLGLSVPPEVPSWGNMLALGRQYLTIFPWMAIYPGIAISITAIGINLLGDWLGDALDPQNEDDA